MMQTALIDYGSGNLHSAHKALERAAQLEGLSVKIMTTSDPYIVRQCDHIMLPGVGAFKDCMAGLSAVPGLREVLQQQVIEKGRPFLGVCVGMQLLATRGLEHEVTAGLGWVAGDVRLIEPSQAEIKIPHMGWNTITPLVQHSLFDDIPMGATGLHGYFVHSYQFETTLPEDVLATTHYGTEIPAIVGYENIIGTQFHPEKSQQLGLKFLGNFLRWKP